eukprot:gene899-4162_t
MATYFVKNRPSQVQEACTNKFEACQANAMSKASGWVFTGETSGRIYLDMQGRYIPTDDVFHRILSQWQLRHVNTAATEPSFPRFLDLGTGDGSLLMHLHQKFTWPYDRMLGISAVDERSMGNSTLSVPDTSYLTGNIDELHVLISEACTNNANPEEGIGKFDLIWSSHTFYHLVDPIGAVCTTCNLLDLGGIAILRNVPTSLTGINSNEFQEYMTDSGLLVCISPMPDSPGNDMVLLQHPLSEHSHSQLAITPPIKYTGEIRESGSYRFVGLTMDTSQLKSRASKKLPSSNNDVSLSAIKFFQVIFREKSLRLHQIDSDEPNYIQISNQQTSSAVTCSVL